MPEQYGWYHGPIPREPEEVAARPGEDVQVYIGGIAEEGRRASLGPDEWLGSLQPAAAGQSPAPDPTDMHNEGLIADFGNPSCDCSVMDLPFKPMNRDGTAKICPRCWQEYPLGSEL